MKRDSNVLLFRFVYFGVYFADAFFTPFYGLYLLSLGFSSLEVSIVLGLIPFSACLGSLLVGRLAKSFKQSLGLLKLLVVFELVGVILLAFLTSYPALVCTVIFLAFANGVYYQIEDGAVSYVLKRNGKKFNSVRIYGSIGFGVALGVCFFLLKVLSYRWIFVCAAGVYLVCLALLFLLQSYPDEVVKLPGGEKASWGNLFRNTSFVFFFLFYFFLNGSATVGSYILPLYLNLLGLNDSDYSLLNAFRVAIETLSVLLYVPIKKLLRSDRNCLLAGAFILVLGSLSIVIFNNPYAIAFSNYFCRGVGGALLFVSFVDYLAQILPHSLLTRGMTFASALMDVFVGTMNFTSSSIYEQISFLNFFWILCGISFLGFLFLFGVKDERKFALNAPKETE